MKANVGGLDRTLRLIAGALLIVLGIFVVNSSGWTIAFIGLGAILMLTGLARFCAMYLVCGANTCPVKATPPARQRNIIR